MKLDEGDQRSRNMIMAESQSLFNDLVKRFQTLTQLSECMNAVAGNLTPLLIAVDGLAVVAMINEILSENYSATFVYAFRLAKDGLALCMAYSINSEDWFVKAHTQEILRLDSNQLQTMLYDMSKRKIGIGTGAFHIDDGFIANVSNLTNN